MGGVVSKGFNKMARTVKNKAKTSKIKKEKADLKETKENLSQDGDFTQDIEQVISFFSKEEKEEIFKKELKKLEKIFKKLDENKLKIINPLIHQCAFMSAELQDLKELIKEKGSVEWYKNGANQYGRKKSAAVEVYNTMIKNFAAILKQLYDLLPNNNNPEDDGFDDFLNE